MLWGFGSFVVSRFVNVVNIVKVVWGIDSTYKAKVKMFMGLRLSFFKYLSTSALLRIGINGIILLIYDELSST